MSSNARSFDVRSASPWMCSGSCRTWVFMIDGGVGFGAKMIARSRLTNLADLENGRHPAPARRPRDHARAVRAAHRPAARAVVAALGARVLPGQGLLRRRVFLLARRHRLELLQSRLRRRLTRVASGDT